MNELRVGVRNQIYMYHSSVRNRVHFIDEYTNDVECFLLKLLLFPSNYLKNSESVEFYISFASELVDSVEAFATAFAWFRMQAVEPKKDIVFRQSQPPLYLNPYDYFFYP